jgi:hypothetical protein
MVANSSKQQTSGISSTDQVTNFEVKVRILPLGEKELVELTAGRAPFRPGMSASVNIQTASVKNVLSVPVSAVALREVKADSGKSGNGKKEVVFVVTVCWRAVRRTGPSRPLKSSPCWKPGSSLATPVEGWPSAWRPG